MFSITKDTKIHNHEKKNITVTFVFILMLLFLPDVFLFAVVNIGVPDDRKQLGALSAAFVEKMRQVDWQTALKLKGGQIKKTTTGK